MLQHYCEKGVGLTGSDGRLRHGGSGRETTHMERERERIDTTQNEGGSGANGMLTIRRRTDKGEAQLYPSLRVYRSSAHEK